MRRGRMVPGSSHGFGKKTVIICSPRPFQLRLEDGALDARPEDDLVPVLLEDVAEERRELRLARRHREALGDRPIEIVFEHGSQLQRAARKGKRVNGIHDLGGMHGFGPVDAERDEPVFHARWEGRVLGMVYLVVGYGWANVDTFRHGIERTDVVDYLTLGYYGRWRASLERILVERGVLAPGEVDARVAGRPIPAPPPATPPTETEYGFERTRAALPRFAAGASVRARVASPKHHTRLPRYVAGRRGVVAHVRPAYVFPDTNAHRRGEQPQYLYNVRFEGRELWGEDAEANSAVHIDLFEPYLEPA